MYSTYSVFSVLKTFQASVVLWRMEGKQNTPYAGARVHIHVSSVQVVQ